MCAKLLRDVEWQFDIYNRIIENNGFPAYKYTPGQACMDTGTSACHI